MIAINTCSLYKARMQALSLSDITFSLAFSSSGVANHHQVSGEETKTYEAA